MVQIVSIKQIILVNLFTWKFSSSIFQLNLDWFQTLTNVLFFFYFKYFVNNCIELLCVYHCSLLRVQSWELVQYSNAMDGVWSRDGLFFGEINRNPAFGCRNDAKSNEFEKASVSLCFEPSLKNNSTLRHTTIEFFLFTK